jgi:hypothetical protein
MNPRRVLPSLDRFHTPRLEERKPGTFDPSVGPEKWLQFLDKTGLESSVLFPTEGLAYGQVAFPPWAIAYAKAYNDWLHAKYLKYNSRLMGFALIPLQDVPAAVRAAARRERASMVGAMLPSNGLNPRLSAHLLAGLKGSQTGALWRCAVVTATWVLIPTVSRVRWGTVSGIAATGMIVDGVLMFPTLRVGFGRRHQLDSHGH